MIDLTFSKRKRDKVVRSGLVTLDMPNVASMIVDRIARRAPSAQICAKTSVKG